MERLRARNALVFYLAWLGGNAIILALSLSDGLREFVPFLIPENLFTLLGLSEVFFILFLWPLFLPGIMSGRAVVSEDQLFSGETAKVSILVLQMLMLFLLVLPLAMICFALSGVPAGTFIKTHILLFASAIYVASFFVLTMHRKRPIGSIYYSIIFAACAGAPLLYFLLREFGDMSVAALSAFSPFWVLADLDATALGMQSWVSASLLYLGAAVTIFVLAAIKARSQRDG
jgi:hypothetical protein